MSDRDGDTGDKTRTPATIREGTEDRGKIVGVLVAVAGPLAGSSYVLFDGENVLGRESDCTVVLAEQDGRISRRHALLLHRGGQFAIEPLSEEPTRVEMKKIEKGPLTQLSDGAKIHMGWTEFVFRTI